MKSKLQVLFLFSLLGILFSCHDEVDPVKPDPQVISAHSPGLISRSDTLKVEFTRDWGIPGQEAPGDLISLSPSVQGRQRWVDARTLEFQPSQPLGRGMRYRATLNLKTLMPEQSTPYNFDVQVVKGLINLTMGDLTSKNDGYTLSGSIGTEDLETPGAVEKVLVASLEGRKLDISWDHQAKNHDFTILNIPRGTTESFLEIQWNGNSLEQSQSGNQRIEIPGKTTFTHLHSALVQGNQEFIQVNFSDPLLQTQDLQGLLHIPGRNDLRFLSQGNQVKVYASRPFVQGEVLNIEPGVRNQKQSPLATKTLVPLEVETQKPQLKFSGSGVILPDTQGLVIPMETLNLKGVRVQAFQIFGENMTQFLQVNNLDGSSELQRVGQEVWDQVITFDTPEGQINQWVRRGLDLSPLLKAHPDGMFQLRISFRQPQIIWPGYTPPASVDLNQDPESYEEYDYYYDYYEDYEEDNSLRQRKRQDPTENLYYSNSQFKTVDRRMVLVSNLGLSLKKDAVGTYYFFASDLKSTAPLAALPFKVLDFQKREIYTGTTDAQGMAVFTASKGIPAFLIADLKGQKGYLRIMDSDVLETGSFNISGEGVQKGLKGFLYGERGVWRPGDPIHLTFILQDPQKTLPAGHPVSLELRDPQGQVKDRQTLNTGVNGFYYFKTGTLPEDVTGDWYATVKVGDAQFEKYLKIAAIMPNRLKMEFVLPEGETGLSGTLIQGELVSSWLHGAPASELKADINAGFAAVPTVFANYPDYTFDDPAKKFSYDFNTIFEGNLDPEGKAAVEYEVSGLESAPGKLKAKLSMRVFEQSGVFSSEDVSFDYDPHARYVGIRLPEPDERWGMYYTGADHKADLILLDPQGTPVPSGTLEVEFFQVNWWWWWESRNNSLADFVENQSYTPLKKEKVSIRNGKGSFVFRLEGQTWGQYMIRVKDLQGSHSTGKLAYMGWSGWSYKSEKGGPAVLSLSPEKEQVQAGEQIKISIPAAPKGRALVVVESHGQVIQKQWIEATGKEILYSLTATQEMAPNVYIHVSFMQPHLQTANDLPIRLYGITGVEVYAPDSRLEPIIETPESLQPLTTATVAIKEARGRPMTFTLAVVDEGLLRITGFKVPNPWIKFFAREASQLSAWDLYSYVAGAYAGRLDSLLAVGGSDEGNGEGGRKANRFPPVVKFFGPFELGAGKTFTQSFELPNYQGSLRFMVVAGKDKAYGSVEKEVPVRSEVMVFGTLPRVLSIGEEVDFPISVFNFTPGNLPAVVTVETTGPITLMGSKAQTLNFTSPGEQLARFRLQILDTPGIAKVKFTAVAGKATSYQEIELDVRIPGAPVTKYLSQMVEPGKTWEGKLPLPGVSGTNKVQVELTQMVPLELTRNLNYLIQYPYGCIEQTVSSVFPQLYLDKLLEMTPAQAGVVTGNLNAGLKKLKTFQTFSGGLSYWPGETMENEWGTNYAAHFILEAQKKGLNVDQDFLTRLLDYQRTRANAWTDQDKGTNSLVQAYRLFTLALAGSPDLGAMNRLLETTPLASQARWRLALAYSLAGRSDQAVKMTTGLSTEVPPFTDMDTTYGSGYRDEAMILETLIQLQNLGPARTVANRVAKAMNSWSYYSTQSLSYGLLALAKYNLLAGNITDPLEALVTWKDQPGKKFQGKKPLYQEQLPATGTGDQSFKVVNQGKSPLYVQFMAQGIAPPGTEDSYQNGVRLGLSYYDPETYYQGFKSALSPEDLKPGRDILVAVTVTNATNDRLANLALNHLVPGSWEILKDRETPQVITRRSSRWNGGYWEQERPLFDYQDIRDDRITTFFSLQRRETKTFLVQCTLTYGGLFYLPPVSLEAMYDPAIKARIAGRWLGDKSTVKTIDTGRRPGGRILQ